MEKFLIPFIVPLFLGVLFALSARSKPVVLNDKSILLQYGNVMKFIGIAIPLVSWTILSFAILKKPPENRSDLRALIFLFCFPVPFLAYFYLEFFKVKIVINKTKIKAHTPWQGSREYLWSEIEEITYSPTFRWVHIKARGKKELYISVFIAGINEFISYMTTILPEHIYCNVIEKLEKY